MRALACLLVLVAGQAFGENILRNPGFEPPERDGMAEGWINNTWGDCITVFSLDYERPHTGRTCQKIQCIERRGGASQFFQPIKLEAGKLYRVKIWVRAEGDVPWVGAVLRQSPEPYKHHLVGSIEPGKDWELLEFEGINAEAEEQAGLYIWFEAEGKGTVWVDDASVEVMEPQAAQGPPPTGNVVANGSFEVDPTRTWDSVGAPPQWPCTENVAHGTRSLLLRLAGGDTFSLTTPCVVFNGAGLPFTLALSAKAHGGPVAIEANVYSAFQVGQGGSLLRLEAKPDETMRRFSATAPLAPSLNGAYFLRIQGRAEGPAEVWLDAVSLSPKGAAFEPASELEAALSTTAFAGIFAPGEPVKVKLEVFGATKGYDGRFRVEVRDHRERLVGRQDVPLKAPAGRPVAKEIFLPVRRLGAFRADVFAEGAERPLASMVFSVIPGPARVAPQESVIGGHFSTASDWQMEVAQRLGYRWTRIHDCSEITHWAASEPEKGKWKFYDGQVARVRAAGLEILGEFLRVPVWATVAEKGTQAYALGVGPFRDVGEFEEYVRTVVSHYKAEIHYWEIWNEPYGSGFWGGTAEEYAELAKAAARAAKAADPTCTLLAPCTTPYAPEWTEKALAAGALEAADIFSYHGYGCFVKSQYDRVNEWARREGRLLARWNTETGVTARTFYRHVADKLDDAYTRWIDGVTVEEAVAQVVKLFALAIASGADRFFYYWTNVETGMCPRMTSMSIYEYDRTIRPHGVAYAIAGTMLDPCRGAGVREFGGGVSCCLLRHGGQAWAVIWARTKAAGRWAELTDLPGGVRLLDVMGNPIAEAKGGRLRVEVTKEPVYLVGPGGSEGRLARAVERAVGR